MKDNKWVMKGALIPQQRDELGIYTSIYDGVPHLHEQKYVLVSGVSIPDILSHVSEDEFSSMEFTRIGYEEYRTKYLGI